MLVVQGYCLDSAFILSNISFWKWKLIMVIVVKREVLSSIVFMCFVVLTDGGLHIGFYFPTLDQFYWLHVLYVCGWMV